METNDFGIVTPYDDNDTSVFDMIGDASGAKPVDITSGVGNTDMPDVFADEEDEPVSKTEPKGGDAPTATVEEEELDVFSIDTEDDKAKEEEPADDTPEDEEAEGNIYGSFAQDLISSGVYDELGEGEELPTDTESLKEFVHKQKVKAADDYLIKFLSQKGQEYYDAFRAIFVNGVHPEEYFSTLIKDSDVLSLDLEKEENQEKVVRKYYAEVKGLSGSKLERLIGGMKEDGELNDEAITAMEHFEDSKKKELREKEEAKIQDAQRKVQVRQHFNHTVNSFLQEKLTTKEVDGVVLTETVAESVSRFLTAPAYRLPSGEVITEVEKFVMDLTKPENIETAIKIAILKDNNFDFKKIKIKDKAKDAAKDSLFASLAKSKARESATSKSKPQIDNFTTHLKKNY